MSEKTLLVASTLFALMWQPQAWAAGEFGFASQQLEGRVDFLYQEIERLESMIESLGEVDSKPPPDPDPGPQPVECLVTPVHPNQDPLIQHLAPGRIEAEDYDTGGEGIAFHDLTEENIGGMYRPADAVDIKATKDAEGQYQVGWIKGGEWLEYTFCAQPGFYDIAFRVTSNHRTPGSIQVTIDDKLVGRAAVPWTGSWDAQHRTIKIEQVELRGGNQVLRLDFTDPGLLDLNWIEFVKVEEVTNRAPTGILLCDVLPDGTADLNNCERGNPT